jgi:hypothetical protein
MPLPLGAITDTSARSNRDNAVAVAETILARARAECIAAGITPAQFAKLLLPEALLALMIEGLDERQTRAVFGGFVDKEIGEWYERSRGAAERCDCAIDHASELLRGCGAVLGSTDSEGDLSKPVLDGLDHLTV